MNKGAIGDVLQIDPNHLNAYSTGLLQGKAYRVLNTTLTKVLYRYDLSVPEWKILGSLYDHGAMKLADLAVHLDVEAPLVTALIDKLERKEFVQRTQSEKDKRSKIITITDKGKGTIISLEPQVKLSMAKLLKGINRKQLLTYITILETIINNA